MKNIVINEIEYAIECNAYTRILYNSYFKSKIFKDLAEVNKYNVELGKIDELKISQKEKDSRKEQYSFEMLDDILDIICKLTYIVIRTANPNFKEYNEWLKDLPNLDMQGEWITTVIELITDCFRG